MLDDSLSTGRLDPPHRPASPTVTLGESLDDLRESPKPKALEVGARFAGYQIRSYLGRGAMGVVYEAWDITHERRVTLKLVRSPTKRAANRLLREARALARIDHPNIVRIWAADIHRGAVYLVMEMVDGRNLREWLDEPRHWSEILSVLAGAGRGLAAAHAVGILHHDVKPENILVDWDDCARVLDFGIARMSPEHPEHLTLGGEDEQPLDSEDGSPLSGSFANLSAFEVAGLEAKPSLRDSIAYMAPEQHEEGADFRSDQFGFCVTLFEALYGAHPFPTKRAQELIEAAETGRIEFPVGKRSEIPRWVERAIVRGLSPNREERYATMEELLEALERNPLKRRRRRQIMTIAGIGLATVGFGLLVPRAEGRAECVQSSLEDQLEAKALDGDGLAKLSGAREQLPEGLQPRFDLLATGLEDWAASWTEARTAQCQRALEHLDSRAVEAAQTRCFDRQLDQLGAIAARLRETESSSLASLTRHAERALVSLPEPSRCLGETLSVLPSESAEPSGNDTAVDELLALVWQSRVAPEPALAKRAQALIDARTADDPQTRRERVELELVLARVAFELEPARAEDLARACVRESERLADDSLRAEALVELAWAVAAQPLRSSEAVELAEHAAAVLDRIDALLWLRERQARTAARALAASGSTDDARARFELLAGAARERGHELTAAAIDVEIASLDLDAGRAREALTRAEHARETIATTLEPPGSRLARAETLLIRSHLALDEPDQASGALARASALDEAGVDAKELLELETQIALARGNDARAADLLRERLATTSTDLARAALLHDLAQTHRRAGRSETALANFREARRLALGASEHDELLVARTSLGLGLALVETGHQQEATFILEDAAQAWPAALDDEPEGRELSAALAELRRFPKVPQDPADAEDPQ